MRTHRCGYENIPNPPAYFKHRAGAGLSRCPDRTQFFHRRFSLAPRSGMINTPVTPRREAVCTALNGHALAYDQTRTDMKARRLLTSALAWMGLLLPVKPAVAQVSVPTSAPLGN